MITEIAMKLWTVKSILVGFYLCMDMLGPLQNPLAFISDHKQYQPNTDLEINFVDTEGQGFHCILDALLKIIKEYIHLYLNCKQVQHTQTYTVCTAVQLLKEVYQLMDKEERPKWTKVFISASTLKMFIVSISKHRKGKNMKILF